MQLFESDHLKQSCKELSMAWQAYVQHPNNWKNLPDKNNTPQKFYGIQRGKGAPLQLVSPMEGVIEKAKIKLRRQIKRSPPQKKTQSKVSKRRGKSKRKVAPKSKKTKQSKKPAAKRRGRPRKNNKKK